MALLPDHCLRAATAFASWNAWLACLRKSGCAQSCKRSRSGDSVAALPSSPPLCGPCPRPHLCRCSHPPQSYERSNLEIWFKRCQEAGRPCTDPLTRQVLRHTTVSWALWLLPMLPLLLPLPLLLLLLLLLLPLLLASPLPAIQLCSGRCLGLRAVQCGRVALCSHPLPWLALIQVQVVPNFSLKSLVTSWAERHRISDLSTFSKVRSVPCQPCPAALPPTQPRLVDMTRLLLRLGCCVYLSMLSWLG